MQGQLAAIVEGFASAQQRLDRLVASLPEQKWTERSEPTRWSPAECVAHLNLTSRAFIPIIRAALEKCRSIDGKPPTRYRLDFAGWLIWWMSGPAGRFGRMRTTQPFVPQRDLSYSTVVADFARLQNDQIRCTGAADGLPLGNVRVTSPFNSRLRYNVFSALSILPRHQHRHLHQAERVWAME